MIMWSLRPSLLWFLLRALMLGKFTKAVLLMASAVATLADVLGRVPIDD